MPIVLLSCFCIKEARSSSKIPIPAAAAVVGSVLTDCDSDSVGACRIFELSDKVFAECHPSYSVYYSPVTDSSPS